MTSGWGVDATKSGSVITSGTEAADVRKVWGALYTPGVVQGALVTTSASAMTYTVSSGVVVVKTATGEAVMTPVQGAPLTVASPPGTGSRIDVIFAQQRFPVDGDSYSVYRVLSFANEAAVSLPANSQEIRRYQVNAGPANTNAAVIMGGISYSIPYGATLGRLHYYQHTLSGINGGLPDWQRVGNGKFTLPTDRMLKFSITAVLSANGASGFDNSKYCEYSFLPNLNGGDFVIWQTPGLHQSWGTYYFEGTINAPAGENTVNCLFRKAVGPGTPMGHYGTDSSGFGRRGIEFVVEDIGPVV